MKNAKNNTAPQTNPSDQEFDADDLALEGAINKVCQLLNLETLNYRMSDRLDFHTVSVGQIRTAIKVGFAAGKLAAKTADRFVVRGDGNKVRVSVPRD